MSRLCWRACSHRIHKLLLHNYLLHSIVHTVSFNQYNIMAFGVRMRPPEICMHMRLYYALCSGTRRCFLGITHAHTMHTWQAVARCACLCWTKLFGNSGRSRPLWSNENKTRSNRAINVRMHTAHGDSINTPLRNFINAVRKCVAYRLILYLNAWSRTCVG